MKKNRPSLVAAANQPAGRSYTATPASMLKTLVDTNYIKCIVRVPVHYSCSLLLLWNLISSIQQIHLCYLHS